MKLEKETKKKKKKSSSTVERPILFLGKQSEPGEFYQ